jgi:RsiW-degrading membrane proteinase PrsW (M82 family)
VEGKSRYTNAFSLHDKLKIIALHLLKKEDAVNLWLIIAVSIVPGLLWLWFFYRQDAFEPEPKHLLLFLFGLGMVAVLPALWFELPWRDQLIASLHQHNIKRLAFLSYVIVGGGEETAKLIALYITINWSNEFNEPLDGIIYGVTVGLGFASLENLFYASTRGITLGVFRAAVTTLAHASFSGWLGYYMAKAKFRNNPFWMAAGLLLAIFMHGTYDFLLLSVSGLFGIIPMALVGIAVLWLLKKMRALEAVSPFRPVDEGFPNGNVE